MTTQVVPTDEVLGHFSRQQHDWFERVRKGSLDPEAVVRAVHALIDPSFQFDKRQDDWKLLEDVQVPWPISIANLELVPFLKESEGYIVGGEELVRRARKDLHSNLGQRHAEFLLEHQNEIPEEFREYYLIFPGTIWRDHDDCRNVPCLYWDGKRWCLRFFWLVHDFYDFCRLLRPCE